MTLMTVMTGLIPLMALVGLGGALRNQLPETAWRGLDRLNFTYFFPALLFLAASERTLTLEDVAAVAPLVWTIILVAVIVGYGARRFGPDKYIDFAGCWQTTWRFNAGIGFVAVTALDKGNLGMYAVVVGMAVPVGNAFAVSVLSRGEKQDLFETAKKVMLNPFFVSSLLGVCAGLFGLRLPAIAVRSLELLSQPAVTIALISIGATMNWRALSKLDRFSLCINATKLLALPGFVVLTAYFFAQTTGLQGGMVQTLIMYAALPTAAASHVLAGASGADQRLSATMVAQSTLLSAITLPLWIALANGLF